MSVIIKGMKMPKKAMFAAIFPPNDKHDYCYISVVEGKGKGGDYEVIPLPEKHGELIDRDAVLPPIRWADIGADIADAAFIIEGAPAIIDAEGGDAE